MNAHNTPGSDPALRQLLRECGDAPLPPRFQDQVWHRISRTAPHPESGLWAAVAWWGELMFSRPKLAFAYVSTILAIGLVAGTIAAQTTTHRLNADLGHRYVALLDPYHAPGSAP